jgi:hypothetical protein
MRSRFVMCCALFAFTTTGCYKATVNTGLAPSGQTVENAWAHSFIAGLVPPATVETASRCPNGVAQVTTQHSFLNMLVYAITWGLYSPMTIQVQCAAARNDNENDAQAVVTIPASASLAQATDLFNAAAQQSKDSGESVMVRFE